MTDTIDPATRELVGIAAAVAGHCQPCFAYHYQQALQMGVSPDAIRAAVDLAQAIRGAGDRHMDEIVTRRLAAVVAAPDATIDPMP